MGDIADILKVVDKGAAGGAMPAWGNRLSVNQIVMVSAYVASLRGTEPANPKTPPEGRVIPPWPEAPPEPKPESEETESEPS